MTSQGADVYSGAFVHSYQIETIPGTNGLTPPLALTYNSQSSLAKPGLAGSGWSITSNYIERNVNGTANDTTDDWYQLQLSAGGGRLVYNSSQQRFFTRIDQHYHITSHTTSMNEYGMYWNVTTPNGVTYIFGNSNETELVSSTFNQVHRWYLQTVTDPYGNTITYTYEEDPNSGDIGTTYPASITYNNDELRTIQFSYQDRTDRRQLYDNGHKKTAEQILTDITIQYNNTQVRRYHLDYTQFPALSMLNKITQYGADNTSTLPSTTFTYYNNTGWDSSNNNWNLEQKHVFVDNFGRDLGVRFADINFDGYVDYVKEYELCSDGNCSFILLNNGSGWDDESNGSWKIPTLIAGDNFGDSGGILFVDLNSDGRTDIVKRSCPTSCAEEYINNGTGWTTSGGNPWKLNSIYNLDPTYNHGVMTGELNGDGRTDIIKREQCHGNLCNAAAINSENGWINTSIWSLSESFAFADGNGIANPSRLIDINGDGLSDVVKRGSSFKDTNLNTGNGWTSNGIWDLEANFSLTVSGEDAGVRFTDLNGDGLVDVLKRTTGAPTCTGSGLECSKIVLNTGYGWVDATSDWELPSDMSFSGQSLSKNTRIADLNGDGLGDIIKQGNCTGSSCSDVYLNKGFKNYLLKTVRNDYGATTTIDYTNSISFDNTGEDEQSDLPVNIPVVLSIQTDNGLTDNRQVQGYNHYSYQGGKYHYEGPLSEFRGFAQSIEISPEGNNLVHKFHQTTALQGKEYETNNYEGSTTLLNNISKEYSTTDRGGYYYVTQTTQTTKEHDGETTPRTRTVSYTYDQYGNPLSETDQGDTTIDGDEKHTTYTYTYNLSSWIINTPLSTTIKDADNTTQLRQTTYTYNGRGSLLTTTNYLSSGSPIHTYTYDQYGNQLTYKDPRAYTTNYEYDNTGTYKTAEINALAHRTEYEYDYGLGKQTSITDSNGYTTTTIYDTFGRILKQIRPGDTQQQPTTTYSYNRNGVAPETTITTAKINNTLNTTTYTYYDGNKRIIQTKTATATGAIAQDKQYDKQGRNNETSNPYNTASTSYTDINNTAHYTKTTYDAIDRVIKITYPDHTTTTTNYNRSKTRTRDQNGNTKEQETDARGNIITITEHHNEEEYNTTYEYNAVNELLQITDANNIRTNFTYDTLGRKTRQEDPNIGTWTYTYDKNNNLLTQTDARGKTTTNTYDGLNRITQTTTNDEQTNFTYDTNTKGTLSKVQDNTTTTQYQYDNRLRATNETTTIDGETYTTLYTYNSQDAIITITTPDNTRTTYFYDERGQINKVSDVLTHVEYTAAGQVQKREYDNGLETHYTYYDDDLRLKTLITSTLQNYNYTFDAIGNILTIYDDVDDTQDTYTYDDLDRLTSAVRDTVYNYTYTYDIVGRILSIYNKTNTSNYTYTSGPYHAPNSITGPAGDIGISSTPALSITLVSPNSNGNVVKDEFFDFTTEVCCTSGTCGNVTVSLDPKQETTEEYTHYSKKTCNKKTCTTTHHSTVRYGYENGQWKPIEDLKSFKKTVPLRCNVKSDGIHHVECLDYNATHKKLSVRIDDAK